MLTLAAAEGNNTRLLEHCPDSPWKHRRYTRFYTTRSLERTHEHQPSPGFCFQHEKDSRPFCGTIQVWKSKKNIKK